METYCLFGPKTSSLFDIWSFEHILTGFSIACLCQFLLADWWKVVPLNLKPKIMAMAMLNVSFFWEMIEHYLETGLAGAGVVFWLQGVENWSNRLLSDNVMVLFGGYLFSRWPRYINLVRVFSTTWLVAHVFLMPHSMYLQNLFLPNGIGCWSY